MEAANVMTPEQLYSIVAYLCTQGEQSDCDMENITTAIPDAIMTVFEYNVDINFGMDTEATEETAASGEAEDTSEADSQTNPP